MVTHETEVSGSSGRVILVAGVAALGGFLFGFDTSVINGAVDAIRDEFNIGAAADRLRRVDARCSAAPSAPGSPAGSPTGSAASA